MGRFLLTRLGLAAITLFLLSVFVFLWGIPQIKAWLDTLWVARFPVAWLHNMVQKVPPVVLKPVAEGAVYNLNLLSATGTGILLAAILSALLIGYRPMELVRVYGRTLHLVRYSLLTISCMLALGFVTRYSGTDATYPKLEAARSLGLPVVMVERPVLPPAPLAHSLDEIVAFLHGLSPFSPTPRGV